VPAFVNPARCNREWERCFAAKMCPEQAFDVQLDGSIRIEHDRCGKCPGPCVNFCDGYAVIYDRNPITFDITRRRKLGELSDDEALRERQAAARAQAEAARSASSVVDVALDTFESEVLQSALPVVADFWAPWCGPCKAMAPVFEELARIYVEQVKFVKIDTEDQPQLAAHFRITSIPTLLVFSGGQLVDGAVGALPKAQLASFVDRVVAAFGAEAGEIEVEPPA
jgi:thioredoxin 1